MAGKLISELSSLSAFGLSDSIVAQVNGESVLRKATIQTLVNLWAHGSIVLGTPPGSIVSLGSTPVKVVTFDVAIPGTSPGVTSDFTNGRLTIANGGTYNMFFNISFTQGVAGNDSYTLTVYKNGAATNITSTIRTSTTNTNGTRSFNAVLDVADGDYYELYIACTTATRTLTVNFSQFAVNRLG